MEYEISNRLSGVHGSMIRELFKLGASKDIISFGGGNPSAETFPCKEIEENSCKWTQRESCLFITVWTE